MNSNRSLLALGFFLVSFLIFTQWQTDHNPAAQTAKTQSQVITNNTSSDVPSSSDDAISQQKTTGKTIVVESDVLRLVIDTLGGDVVESDLLKHNAQLNGDKPFKLLENNTKTVYVAQSGLVGKNGIDTSTGRPQYQVTADKFTLAEGQDSLIIPLSFEKEGVTYTKTFTLKRGSYDVNVDFIINNTSEQAIEVQAYGQIKHTLEDGSGSLTMPTYMGGAYSSSEDKYEKYAFDKMQEKNLSVNTKAGWIAMLQHYFVSAWVPDQNAENHLYSRTNNDGTASIGYRGPVTTIAPNSQAIIKSNLWTGPKNQEEMAATAKNLDLTVDYGWAWFIADKLFWLLTHIQKLVSNWGIAIICVTIVVKTLLYPLTKAQYTSMAKMRMLQPRLQEMRERFGDDRQRMSQETMKLYKEEKVNPMGGCLPILIQMPIFIALYWTFMEAVELRHAPFFGWIQDLSAQDPYYIMPLLMGASMFLLQKMSPTPVADPMQQKVMMFMPVIFTGFFLFFPSGLVLYWITSNTITIVQQWLIYRNLEKKGLHTRNKK